jgi:hypothetical protein
VKSLTISPTAAPDISAARLDLTNNAVVIDYAFGQTSPLIGVRELIREGYNGGSWDGNGIATSLGNSSTHGLGYGEASALTTIPPIFGSVDPTTVLVRYTRYGDADLNAIVNLDDFNRLAANFGSSSAFWTHGDFNYDTLVNLDDFNRLAGNFGLVASPGGPTPADWSALAAAVPEPSLLWLTALDGVLIPRRPGRNRRPRLL